MWLFIFPFMSQVVLRGLRSIKHKKKHFHSFEELPLTSIECFPDNIIQRNIVVNLELLKCNSWITRVLFQCYRTGGESDGRLLSSAEAN